RAAPFTVYSAVPADENLPAVEVWLNESCDVVDFVAFGHWHGHFEGAADEEENIRRAFRVANGLSKGRLHVIDQFTLHGKFFGSELHKGGVQLPRRLENADYAERLVFGKRPERISLPNAG